MEFELNFGYIIGVIGIMLGLGVAPPQLVKILKTKSCNDVSILTYIFLVLALACYLAHAIYIRSLVFSIAQSISLTVNTIILILLFIHRRKDATTKDKY